jgi:hypothetical protein
MYVINYKFTPKGKRLCHTDNFIESMTLCTYLSSHHLTVDPGANLIVKLNIFLHFKTNITVILLKNIPQIITQSYLKENQFPNKIIISNMTKF